MLLSSDVSNKLALITDLKRIYVNVICSNRCFVFLQTPLLNSSPCIRTCRDQAVLHSNAEGKAVVITIPEEGFHINVINTESNTSWERVYRPLGYPKRDCALGCKLLSSKSILSSLIEAIYVEERHHLTRRNNLGTDRYLRPGTSGMRRVGSHGR